MTKIVKEIGAKKAFEKVDVVTTGTFGAMCSSGIWINFGHADPPIKMSRVWLNGVEAYAGVAAVDAYLGVTQPSESHGIKYGGAHVIEDLINRKPIIVRAEAYETDCYPRKNIETQITIDDLNQAIMCNPRNAYQKYNVATNSSDRVLYTYMGKLLPNFGNATYSGAGELSPIMNDPTFETIGIGTRIFLGGTQGYIIGNGTQHDPKNGLSTLMVIGNLKEMSNKFLKAVTFTGYGCTLYVGIGIPIPILNEKIAENTGISDSEIITNVIDYGIPSRSRPILKKVNYAELKSGYIEIKGKKVKTSPLSSFSKAKLIAQLLKEWIENGKFLLSESVQKISLEDSFKPMVMREPEKIEYYKNRKIKLPKDRYLYKDENKCIHCGACISICPVDVFYHDEKWIVRADYKKCTGCGICEDVCPAGAIYVQ